MLVRIAQVVFLTLLIGSVALASLKLGEIRIDTNLSGIAANTQNSAATSRAIGKLRSDVENRLTLLISSADEDQAYDAEDWLRGELSKVDILQVHPSSEVLSEQLISQLLPYRFTLLTATQREKLLRIDRTLLAQQTKDSLYGLAGQTNLLGFEKDPFAVHSQTLIELFSSIGGPQTLDENGAASLETHFALPISMSIREGGLDLDLQTKLTQQLNDLIGQTVKDFGVEIDRSGVFFFAAHAAQSSKSDISLISAGSSIGVALLLLLVFRSFKALALPVISVLLGVGFAFIASHLIYGKVHILTIVFGASLIGVVIDYSLHYFYHSAQGDKDKSEKHALLRALSLSLFTSIVGYSALAFSGLESLQKVAVFSCLGLVMAWLSVVCLGDRFIKVTVNSEQTFLAKLIALALSPIRKITPAVWASLGVIVILAGLAIAVIHKPFNDDPKVFFTAPPALLESERRVAEVANDFEPGRYIIITGENSDEVYRRFSQLSDGLKQSDIDPESFTSLLDWVPSAQEQASNHTAQAALYSASGALQQLAELMPLSNLKDLQQEYQTAASQILTANDVSRFLGNSLPPLWIEHDGKIASFLLIKKGVNTDSLANITSSIVGVDYINTLAQTEATLSQQRISAGKLLLLAYALVGFCLMIRFRSASALWMLCVPLSASAVLLILVAALGMQLNLFHTMGLFLVLGFGMDYSIFVREMREHVDVTLQAILLSALTSILSFGLLSLSAIPIVASFGMTLFVGNSFNLIAALVYSNCQQPTES